MVKGSKEDIAFSNTVYLSEEHYRKFPIYMRLLQALVIFIGSYCFMTIFNKCFDLPLINKQIIAAIIISGLVFSALFLFPKYDLLKLIFVLAIYGGISYKWFGNLKNGFILLENTIIELASSYYGFPTFRFAADSKMATRDITLLFIMIIIPVVGIITMSLLRGKGRVLCYIILLFPVIVSFAMGVTPPEVDLLCHITVLLFLSISNGFYHDKGCGNIQENMVYRVNIRSASIFVFLSILLFLFIKQFVPVEKYNDYKGINEAKTQIQGFMRDFSIQDVSNKLSNTKWNIRPNRFEGTGGLNLGKLGRVDQINYDETEHLHITAPLQSVIEGIYLKGYIGSEYTGNSWETHSKPARKSFKEMIAKISKEDFEPAIGGSILLNQFPYRNYISQGIIEVSYDKANKNYIYAPYFTIFNDKEEASFEYDLGAISKKDMLAATYTYSYNIENLIYNSNIEGDAEYIDLIKFIENERVYRKFVYEIYTILPEKGLDRLKHDFSREEVGPASENVLDAIDYIKDYLGQHMSYTLSPGRLPKKEDFVEYFLYENKVGYCSHFASAGALMLRAMGYPARYVEGYAVNRNDLLNQGTESYIGADNSVDITVKDYNAHAWVEVYYDGFGWVPVEFTVGAEMEDMVDTIGDIEQADLGIMENEPLKPTDLPPSPTALPDKDVNPSPPASLPDEDMSTSILGEDNKSGKEFRWYIALIIIIIILAFIVLCQIFKPRRSRDIVKECYSKRALRIYKAIEKLLILNRGLPKSYRSLEECEEYVRDHLSLASVVDFEECMNTVRKARFGRETISLVEYKKVEQFYCDLRNRIYYGIHPIKKVYYRITHQI